VLSRPAAGRLLDRGAVPGQGHGRGLRPERAAHPGTTAAWLLARLRPERGRLVAIVGLCLVSVGFTVAGPALLGQATDIVFRGVIGRRLPAGPSLHQEVANLRASGDSSLARLLPVLAVVPGRGVDVARLGGVLGVAALLCVAAGGLGWLQGYLMAGVAQRAIYGLRQDVADKLARLPLRYFDGHPHGEILSRVTGDIDNLSTTLQQSLGQLLGSLLTIVGAVSMMFWISWLLALVTAVTIPVATVLTVRVARRSQTYFADQWDWAGSITGQVEQAYAGHLEIQAFGGQAVSRREFDRQNEHLVHATFSAQFLSGVIQPAMQFLANLNYVTIAVFGGYRVVTGTMTLGEVQAFIHYSRQLTMPINQIASQLNLLQSGLASAERVITFLSTPEQAEQRSGPARRARPIPLPPSRVTLERVCFRYQPDAPLIEEFSLEVDPGQTVAIVGPTGAGKTTIVNLLMRFYEISSGRIRLDGLDYADLTVTEVRRCFGMVLQDTWLFAGSIRDNISYGRPGASTEQIMAAAAAARVDRFVSALPDGYDTLLQPDAANISAGQRQLITIARAFIADPAILILDEATSHVDTRTEAMIAESMTRLRRGRTSFVIAHRLATVRRADVIVVMSGGRIAEQGSHVELLARGGLYREMYDRQQYAR
jgi:ATP-binding cassette subfamily B multidrug efflux pump